MNTQQIERLLHDTKRFDSVYSTDTLPVKPRLLVCNIEPSHLPGNHWIAIWVDDDAERGEYFDPLGRSPPETLSRYMNFVCANWTYNSRQLQSIVSAFCGHYCVMFCMLRSRNVTMNDFVSSFTTDTAFNDYYVHAFVCLNK